MKKLNFSKIKELIMANKKYILLALLIFLITFVVACCLYCNSLLSSINLNCNNYRYSKDHWAKSTAIHYINKFITFNKLTFSLPVLFLDNSTILNIAEVSDEYQIALNFSRKIRNATGEEQQRKCAILQNYYSYTDNSDHKKELIGCLDIVINNNPDNAENYINRANFQTDKIKKIDDYKKAIEILNKELAPGNSEFICSETSGYDCRLEKEKLRIDAYLGLFNETNSLNNDKETLEIAEKISNLMFWNHKFIDPLFYNKLGHLHMKAGNKIAAYDNYLTALYHAPYIESFYYDLIKTIENNASLVEYGIGLPPIIPKDFTVHYDGTLRRRAYIETARCLKERSYITCENAIQLNQQAETDFAFVAYKTLGDLNRDLKDYKSAFINYEIALRRYSGDAESYYRHYIPTDEENWKSLSDKTPYNRNFLSVHSYFKEKIREPIESAMNTIK